MFIFVAIVAIAVSAYSAYSFYKASMFKLTASSETMLAAGYGWIEKFPLWVVRLIAIIELVAVVGLIVSPIAYFAGVEWAIWFAVAAAAGLALTMLVAFLMHAARGELKYTAKTNLTLLAGSALSAVSWSILPFV